MYHRVTARTVSPVLPIAGQILWVLLTCVYPPILAGPDRFEARRDYPAPTNTQAATLADLNGDGVADLVSVSSTPHLQVRFNNGDGSFGEPASYMLGCGDPFGVAAADFDADEDLDLVLACRASDRFTVLWNDGVGGFPDYTHYMYVGEEPKAIVATDLDGNGAPDVAFTLQAKDSLAVYVNDGGGNLLFHGKYDSGGDEPYDLCAAPVNDDSFPDLIVGHRYGGNIAVFMNRQDGTFDPPVSYPIEQAALGVAAGDVDGDEVLDLVAVNSSPVFQPTETAGIALLRGFPGGTFGPAEYTYFGAAPHDLELGDLDLDEDLDIAVAEDPWEIGYAQSWYFLENDGTGNFTPHAPRPTSQGPKHVTVGDFAGSQEPEIVLVCRRGDAISTFRNLGGGVFREAETLLSDVYTQDCEAADLDGDNRRDLVVSVSTGYRIEILFNDGSGNFDVTDTYPLPGRPRAIEIDDYDGDEEPDIAVSLTTADGIGIMLNDGQGSFSSPQVYGTGSSPAWLVSSDLDKDGDKDLVVPNHESMFLTVLWNDGTAGFDDSEHLFTGDDAWNVAVDDFDENDWPDLAVLGATGGVQEVWVFFNDGAGGFPEPVKLPVEDGEGLITITSANLDEDELPDIAVADWYMYRRVHILWNEGDGSFVEGEPLSSGREPFLIRTGDVDNDDLDDLLVGNMLDYFDIGVFRNLGARTFDTPEFYGCLMDPLGFDLADLDDDSDKDLVAATEWGVSLLWGRTHEITGVGERGGVESTTIVGPNPFQRSTRLAYELEEPAHVQFTVIDVRGRLVWKLMAGTKPPGLHYISWDGQDDSGRFVASGVYFLSARIGGRAEVRRVVRIR